ncbi:MAG TPA: hypothetical protein VFR66_06250 [Burkholderiales bacterium]|nr:hypothetical protein [Burkholderiales bacterium]
MNPTRHAWIASLVLAACAAPATQWEKPGATAATVQADDDQCLADARFNAPQPAAFDQTGTVATRVLTVEEQRRRNEVEYFQKCMQEKGYSAKR